MSDLVRDLVNGDEETVEDLMGQGYYVLSISTHAQTGNQHNRETGRLKDEADTGYITCETTGLLYILRKDEGQG